MKLIEVVETTVWWLRYRVLRLKFTAEDLLDIPPGELVDAVDHLAQNLTWKEGCTAEQKRRVVLEALMYAHEGTP